MSMIRCYARIKNPSASSTASSARLYMRVTHQFIHKKHKDHAFKIVEVTIAVCTYYGEPLQCHELFLASILVNVAMLHYVVLRYIYVKLITMCT